MQVNKKQVVEILTQAINIAVGSGAFKNTKDVAVINQALDALTEDYVDKDKQVKEYYDGEPCKSETKPEVEG